MAQEDKVKVFISWSGSLARSVTQSLRSWLPLLLDPISPWASDTDIAAGQRGLAQIESELAQTSFGIVVVTPENQHAPWLNFEAGVLSKAVGDDPERRVIPLLVGLSSPTELTGPLAQFQAKVADESGVRDVVLSLASIAGIAELTVNARFSTFWPQLRDKIESAKAEESKENHVVAAPRDEADVLDEILMHVRSFRSGSVLPNLTPTGSQKIQNDFQRFVTDLAAKHGMKVFDIEEVAFKDHRITLSPEAGYSEDSEEAVKRAFDEAAAVKRAKMEVSVIPF